MAAAIGGITGTFIHYSPLPSPINTSWQIIWSYFFFNIHRVTVTYNFFISYGCFSSCFSAILWASCAKCLLFWCHFLSKIVIIRDIFVNQLIQFYSNNAINLHQLTTHSTTVLPHRIEIVLRPHTWRHTWRHSTLCILLFCSFWNC